MTTPNPIVFLVDVDDTLLDNDRIQDDLKRHIEREFGAAAAPPGLWDPTPKIL